MAVGRPPSLHGRPPVFSALPYPVSGYTSFSVHHLCVKGFGMDEHSKNEESKEPTLAERRDLAIRQTAPGTSLRVALDMILAGNLGALICVGDEDAVLAAGGDGFPLDISFTANRLFELSKMDGAIVIDHDLNTILRANFHLNPDPGLPTSETGMRHRTASRMSLLTKATVISVSQRRQVINLYVDGRRFELRSVSELMTTVNRLLVTLQQSRQALDRALLRLSSLELDGYVTLADITNIFSNFEILDLADRELRNCVVQLGSEGRTVELQREQFVRGMDEDYTLMVRDYAADSSAENAVRIRKELHDLARSQQFHSSRKVAEALGYPDLREDSVMAPLGLRTLSRVSVVREGMEEDIIDEYGSLQDVLSDMKENPERLEEIGVNNPVVLIDSLSRMTGNLG